MQVGEVCTCHQVSLAVVGVWGDHMHGVLHHALSQLLVKEHDDDYHHRVLVLSTCFRIEDDVYTSPPLAW